jgi:glutaredoxin-like YruB-family protein
MSTKKVIIYSTPTCVYCKAAKDFFDKNKVQFTEYNVASDIERRKEMVDKTGQMGVPVILIGDEAIVGFNQDAIIELLGIK